MSKSEIRTETSLAIAGIHWTGTRTACAMEEFLPALASARSVIVTLAHRSATG